MTRLKLARPSEIPILRMAGYEEVGPWDSSFIIMRLPPSRETSVEHVELKDQSESAVAQ